jgi:DUF4097 and DUF4098 domain-containing protein YvlB
LVVLTAFIFLLGCGDDGPVDSDHDVRNTDFVAQETVSFQVVVTDQIRLKLEAINGNVSIAGVTEANSVDVIGEKRVGSDSMEDAQEHLLELEVNVQDTADEIVIKTIQPQETHGRSYVIDYTITLPSDLEVSIENGNGVVTIEAINNLVSVMNINGLVDLNEIFGSTQVALVNGQIESEVTLPLDGTIGMTTVNGMIELHIPQSTSAEFSASVGNGAISISNLDLKDQVSTSTSLSGTLGEGQGTISLGTGNGNIIVVGF